MDSTWLRARPQAVGAVVAEAASWPRWWPGLALRPSEFRGDRGVRWDVTSVRDHPGLTGTAELYLQAQGDGVVAHFFLRLDAAAGVTMTALEIERLRTRYRRLSKTALWGLGDQLDPGRLDRHTSATHTAVT